MLTKDFIKEVQELGLKTSEKLNVISIYDGDYQVFCVYKNVLFSVNTAYAAFDDLSEELKEKLYSLIHKYISTPLDEREEPQKFYLRFTALEDNDCFNYLNYNSKNDLLRLSDRSQSPMFQTQFTQKEIDEIRERFKVTLSDFEQIPVEDKEKEDVDNK